MPIDNNQKRMEAYLGFCPNCGSHTELCEGRTRYRSCCPVCDFVVYYNPLPAVITTVIDGDRALFVKRARPPAKGCWSRPGGYMEMDESPADGAARELAEETGLEVDPADLELVDTDREWLDDQRAVVDIVFAVPLEKTTGTPVPGDDAADIALWPREKIADDPPDLQAGNVRSILDVIDTSGAARPQEIDQRGLMDLLC